MRHLGRGLQNFLAEVLHRANGRDGLYFLNMKNIKKRNNKNKVNEYPISNHIPSTSNFCLVNTVGEHANGAYWHERCRPLAAVAHVLQVLDPG